MSGEIWKDVEGYEGYYQVSNFGRVKSLKRTVKRRNNYDLNIKERIKPGQLDKAGYYRLSLCKYGITKTKKVHRLVAEAFLEKRKGADHVNHIDGNKINNFKDNLEWCTNIENLKHAYDNGLYTPPKRIFDEIQELTIFTLNKCGWSLRKIARYYKTSMTPIRNSIKRVRDRFGIY